MSSKKYEYLNIDLEDVADETHARKALKKANARAGSMWGTNWYSRFVLGGVGFILGSVATAATMVYGMGYSRAAKVEVDINSGTGATPMRKSG
jgi:hypothetical protein